VLINAETGQRVDVLPGRTAEALQAWLREHPSVEVVRRDGSGAYAQGVHQALPSAVQVGDRWHLWHGLAGAVLKEVAAHSSCWAAAGPPLKQGKQAQTTAERWRQVHGLLDKGTGLLECSRRLGLSLNTVKRYARSAEPRRVAGGHVVVKCGGSYQEFRFSHCLSPRGRHLGGSGGPASLRVPSAEW
jgi:hypothetical protein